MIKSHKHDMINDDILNRLDELVTSDADIDAAGDVTDAKDSNLSDDDILDRLDEIVASDADIDAAGDVTNAKDSNLSDDDILNRLDIIRQSKFKVGIADDAIILDLDSESFDDLSLGDKFCIIESVYFELLYRRPALVSVLSSWWRHFGLMNRLMNSNLIGSFYCSQRSLSDFEFASAIVHIHDSNLSDDDILSGVKARLNRKLATLDEVTQYNSRYIDRVSVTMDGCGHHFSYHSEERVASDADIDAAGDVTR